MMERAYDNIIIVITFIKLINYFITYKFLAKNTNILTEAELEAQIHKYSTLVTSTCMHIPQIFNYRKGRLLVSPRPHPVTPTAKDRLAN